MTTETTTVGAVEAIERIRAGKDAILREIRKVIIGQDQVVQDVVAAFFAGGRATAASAIVLVLLAAAGVAFAVFLAGL